MLRIVVGSRSNGSMQLHGSAIDGVKVDDEKLMRLVKILDAQLRYRLRGPRQATAAVVVATTGVTEQITPSR